MNKQQLFLKPYEGLFLGMAVGRMLEELKDSLGNIKFNWTPETRKMLREMVDAGSSLKIKLGKLRIDCAELPPFIDGDEEEFLTKQS